MLKLQIMTTLGFSPCPNDTFIFYAIANKRIETKGLDFNPIIEDVESLNQLAIKKLLDVTKISCHAFYYLQNDYQFLRTGGAFGRGCGPLLVQKSKVSLQDPVGSQKSDKGEFKFTKIAIPGELTTAFLLLKLYLSSKNSSLVTRHSSLSFIAMPFYKIMEAVKNGGVDAGLIIHESRFTYPDYGLAQIIDLGEWWENETGLPIPLGGIIAKKSLGLPTIKTIESLIRASVEYSISHREKVMPFVKKYSQELSDDVILKHISLYVNDYTLDIGSDGEAALDELMEKANRIELRQMAGR
jgi:1,4-dihydroxy-6-naphthoate synthase